MSACNAILLALIARDRLGRGQQVEVALIDRRVDDRFLRHGLSDQRREPGRLRKFAERLGHWSVSTIRYFDGPLYMACANDRLYRRLVVDVLDLLDLYDIPKSAHRKNRTANKEKLGHHRRCVRAATALAVLDGQDQEGQHTGGLSAHRGGRLQRAVAGVTAIASARSASTAVLNIETPLHLADANHRSGGGCCWANTLASKTFCHSLE